MRVYVLGFFIFKHQGDGVIEIISSVKTGLYSYGAVFSNIAGFALDDDYGEAIVEITGVFELRADDPFAFCVDETPLPSLGCGNRLGLEIKVRNSDLAKGRPADDVPGGVHQSVPHVIAVSRPEIVHGPIIH